MRTATTALAVLTIVFVASSRRVEAQSAERPPSIAARPPVTALALAPDEQSILVGSQAGLEIRSWPKLDVVGSLATELTNVHDLTFSPDGRLMAVAGGEPGQRGSVELYRWPSRELLHRSSPHTDLVYAVAWRRDSLQFATASADRLVGVHDVASGKTVQTFNGHSRAVLVICYLPGSENLVTTGADESIRLWDAAGNLTRSLTNHTRPVNSLASRPGGDANAALWIASASDDRTVRFWQPTIGRLVRFIRLESPPQAIAWTPDGRSLVVACKDGHVRTIDPETAHLVDDRPVLHGVAHSLAIAADQSLAVGGQDGQLRRIVLNAKSSD